jgi:hypothetical protein
MKLKPLRGIDDIEFGSPISTIISRLGAPTETRLMKDTALVKMLFYKQHFLTLGFYSNDLLGWLAITCEATDTELWGAKPFLFVSSGEQDFCAPLIRWLASKDKKTISDQTCFGATVSVPVDGLVFCIAFNGNVIVEGIQLESPQHFVK